jgi:hypothetical protein
MTRHHAPEISEVVRPEVRAVQRDLSDSNRAPIRGCGENIPVVVVHGGNHPSGPGLHEGAAHEVDVVFAGPLTQK